MNEVPNYSEYSLATLEDILNHIDKKKYPEKVKIINEEIAKKKEESQQEINKEGPKILTEGDKKSELIKLVSIAGVVFLLSSFSFYRIRLVLFNQFILAYIPLFIILLFSLLSIIYLSKRKYVGVELLMYSQIPLLVSFLLGNFYYFSNVGYLIFVGITFGDGLGLSFNIDFGNFQFMLGKINSDYSFLFGINFIPAILYLYLKRRTDYYKKIFE